MFDWLKAIDSEIETPRQQRKIPIAQLEPLAREWGEE
jgi:hypothetical protein